MWSGWFFICWWFGICKTSQSNNSNNRRTFNIGSQSVSSLLCVPMIILQPLYKRVTLKSCVVFGLALRLHIRAHCWSRGIVRPLSPFARASRPTTVPLIYDISGIAFYTYSAILIQHHPAVTRKTKRHLCPVLRTFDFDLLADFRVRCSWCLKK